MTEPSDERPPRGPVQPRCLRVVRVGHGGNCSSVGSVIDTLFLGAAAGGAVFAAICAAMQDEEIKVVNEGGEAKATPPDEEAR